MFNRLLQNCTNQGKTNTCIRCLAVTCEALYGSARSLAHAFIQAGINMADILAGRPDVSSIAHTDLIIPTASTNPRPTVQTLAF